MQSARLFKANILRYAPPLEHQQQFERNMVIFVPSETLKYFKNTIAQGTDYKY